MVGIRDYIVISRGTISFRMRPPQLGTERVDYKQSLYLHDSFPFFPDEFHIAICNVAQYVVDSATITFRLTHIFVRFHVHPSQIKQNCFVTCLYSGRALCITYRAGKYVLPNTEKYVQTERSYILIGVFWKLIPRGKYKKFSQYIFEVNI